MLAVAIIVYVVVTENRGQIFVGMLVASLVYLGSGSAWMIAGWFYWHRQYRNALIANVVGVVSCVLIAILI
jgi:hypothetical protein